MEVVVWNPSTRFFTNANVNRVAISEGRILSYDRETVTFKAKDNKQGGKWVVIKVRLQEFIRRFLLHILPKGFQKIRYYGYLSNSQRKKNVARIQKQQKKQRFVSRFAGMGKSEILLELFSDDYHICPRCGADMVKVDFKPRPEAKSNSA
ncbi:MAG: transposase [Lachnospiraceae bacterium]|nr:transposase [Lachnospiraceae bacterium]